MGLSSGDGVFAYREIACIYSRVGRTSSRRALLRNHWTIVRGTRFILSIRRKSAFICEATVKAILAEGVYMLEGGKSVYDGGKCGREEKLEWAKERQG